MKNQFLTFFFYTILLILFSYYILFYKFNKSPLHIAFDNKNDEIIKLLLDNRNIDVTVKDSI